MRVRMMKPMTLPSKTVVLTIITTMALSAIVLLMVTTDSEDNVEGDTSAANMVDDDVHNFFRRLGRRHPREVFSGKDGISCSTKHVTRTGGYCLSEDGVFDGMNAIWDGQLCAGLEGLFGKNSSVGDFGAGLGHYGRCFLRRKKGVIYSNNLEEIFYMDGAYQSEMTHGKLLGSKQVVASWKGFDGALNIGKLSKGFIRELDLTERVDLGGEKFDWVMSLEVGEHIPKRYERTFLENLVRHACKGLVLTWAIEVGKGHYHVNPQSNRYIREQVEGLGLLHDPAAQDILRRTARLPHFKDSLMVFRVPRDKCQR